MRKKEGLILLLLLLGVLLVWGSIRAEAAEEPEEETVPEAAREWIDEMDFRNVDKMMDEIFQKEQIEFTELVETLLSGDVTGALAMAGRGIGGTVFSVLSENKTAMLHILVIALIAAVFANFSQVFAAGQAADTGFFILYLLLITLLLQTFEVMIDSVTKSLTLLTDFMQALCPVYLMAAAVVTGSGSSLVFYNLMLFLIYLVQSVVCSFVLPLIHVYLMIRLMDELSPEPYLGRFAELGQTIISWILKTILVGVMGVNLIQGLLSPVIDEVRRSGLQRGLESIPGIGNTLGGMTEIVMSALTLIRNGIGVAGALICVGICLIPVIQIAVLALIYKLLAALLEPVSDSRIIGCVAGSRGCGSAAFKDGIHKRGAVFDYDCDCGGHSVIGGDMFTYIYDWIKNLVFYLILMTMLMQIIPDSDYKKYIRFFTGLVLILLLARPVFGIFHLEEEFDRIYHSIEYHQNVREMERAREVFESAEEGYLEWEQDMASEASGERETSNEE